MAYRVKEMWQDKTIIAPPPIRRKNGRFELSKCSQTDLKYLYQIVKHPAVEMYDTSKKN